jgi:hypothetical protein
VTRNAQVFRLVSKVAENEGDDTPILDAKEFYVTALTAVDPVAAVKLFINRKATSSRFRATDAARLLTAERMTKSHATSVALDAARPADRATLSAHFEKARDIVQALLVECPNEELAEDIYGECLSNIDDQIAEMFDEDAGAAIRKAHEDGHKAEDAMARVTGFPLDVVSRLMGRFGEEGDYILVPQVAGAPRLWHKVGDTVPEALRVRSA